MIDVNPKKVADVIVYTTLTLFVFLPWAVGVFTIMFYLAK